MTSVIFLQLADRSGFDDGGSLFHLENDDFSDTAFCQSSRTVYGYSIGAVPWMPAKNNLIFPRQSAKGGGRGLARVPL